MNELLNALLNVLIYAYRYVALHKYVRMHCAGPCANASLIGADVKRDSIDLNYHSET